MFNTFLIKYFYHFILIIFYYLEKNDLYFFYKTINYNKS